MTVSKIASQIYKTAKAAAEGVWNWRLEWAKAMKQAWRKVMTERERKQAAKIRKGIYMLHYIQLRSGKKKTLVGTKYEVKRRLKAHGGLLNQVHVSRFNGKSWVRVLMNGDYEPVNTLFTKEELWNINTKKHEL